MEKTRYTATWEHTQATLPQSLSHAQGGKYERIYALEPERKNFQKCLKNLKANDNISLYNAAAWSIDTELYFAGGAGRQGRVDTAGKRFVQEVWTAFLQAKNAPI